ncbi:MAG: tetratricopeptide repeat protein [Chloroflexi bacterium]|nr:tetratricopeptide repeat protein [Chloroflexota bacterium]
MKKIRDIEDKNESVLEPVPDDLRNYIKNTILRTETIAKESGAAGEPVYLLDGIPYSDNSDLVESIGKITLLISRNKYNEASDEIKKAQLLVTTPSQKMALYLLEGSCKYSLGRQKDAEKDLNEILEIADSIRQKTGGEIPGKDIRSLEAAALGNISLIYQDRGELDKALRYHEDALKIHREIGYRQGEASDLINIGLIYQARGELDKALRYHEDALKIHREIGYRQGEANALSNFGLIYNEILKIADRIREKTGEETPGEDIRSHEAATLSNIGLIYQDKGELDKALRYHEDALKIHREIGYRLSEASDLGNIGLIYKAMGALDKALRYHEDALKIHREIGYRQGEANALGNISLIYQARGELDKALRYHEDALKIHREIGYRLGEATALSNIGLIYQARGELDKALRYHEDALKIHREIGYRLGEANALGNIGLIYQDRGEPDKALEYLQKAGLIFNEIGAVHLTIHTLKNIAFVHIKKGEPEKGFEHLSGIFSKVSSPVQFLNIVRYTLDFTRFLASSENWDALSKIDSLYNTGNIQDKELISVFKAVREYALYKISGDGARLENFQKIRGELSKETRELLDSAIEPD